MAYATVADVKSRTTRSFTPEEENVIATLLDDAEVLIDRCNKSAPDEAKIAVSCRMVIRAMGDGSGYGVPVGATQGSMTAGSYTQSWTMGTGVSGELYLGKADKVMLGASNKIGASNPLEGMVAQ